MAGPNGTGIIDSFTRANASTLGAAWDDDIAGLGFHPSLYIVSNQCAKGAGGGFQSNWYLTSYGANQEVYATVPTLPDGNGGSLLARIQNPGTVNAAFYEVGIMAGDNYYLSRITDCAGGGRTLAYADDSGVACVAGDKVALSCIGSAIKLWRDSGSGWVNIYSKTDSNINASGYLGIWVQNITVGILDDFGGGTISAGQTVVPDADVTVGGWATSPLFSKINDSSDATVITATSS